MYDFFKSFQEEKCIEKVKKVHLVKVHIACKYLCFCVKTCVDFVFSFLMKSPPTSIRSPAAWRMQWFLKKGRSGRTCEDFHIYVLKSSLWDESMKKQKESVVCSLTTQKVQGWENILICLNEKWLKTEILWKPFYNIPDASCRSHWREALKPDQSNKYKPNGEKKE